MTGASLAAEGSCSTRCPVPWGRWEEASPLEGSCGAAAWRPVISRQPPARDSGPCCGTSRTPSSPRSVGGATGRPCNGRDAFVGAGRWQRSRVSLSGLLRGPASCVPDRCCNICRAQGTQPNAQPDEHPRKGAITRRLPRAALPATSGTRRRQPRQAPRALGAARGSPRPRRPPPPRLQSRGRACASARRSLASRPPRPLPCAAAAPCRTAPSGTGRPR
mmetsp:Transcript_3625/g.15075  ORF Transcript_3625/g.15075 Transcript_3625/m.15075 type:complete len:219 (+) Transcript_3625:717-1373(+)